jgi:TolA-binding protein
MPEPTFYFTAITAFPGHSITDDALMKKAEIRIKQGKFTEAEALYRKVADDFGDGILGDDALFSLALLYDPGAVGKTENLSISPSLMFFLDIRDPQIKDNAKAMAAYQELLVKYPGSIYTVDARKRFRSLRGDQVN